MATSIEYRLAAAELSHLLVGLETWRPAILEYKLSAPYPPGPRHLATSNPEIQVISSRAEPSKLRDLATRNPGMQAISS